MVLRDTFVEAMSRAVGSVYVVSTDGPAGRAGMTVSAVTSVSADGPAPTLLICLNHLAPTAAAVQANEGFCVNLLASEQQQVGHVFAGGTGLSGMERFGGEGCGTWHPSDAGQPMLEGALFAMDCAVLQQQQLGTHHVVVGQVRQVALSEDLSAPLLYGQRGYRLLRGE